MEGLIKAEGTFLVHKITKYGTLVHVAPEYLTKEQKSIVEAYTAPNLTTLSDKELLPKLSGIIARAFIELGHKKSLEDDNEFKIMLNAIYTDIREKYEFLSVPDLELIFKFGARGDFKNKPEDVVFINRDQVNNWLKCYHRQKRADVITQLLPLEKPKEKPKEYNAENDFNTFVQKIKAGEPVNDTEWICQTAQHYERLKQSNAFNLSTAERAAIYREEREKLKHEGKNKMLHVNTETRFLFRAFVEGQKEENHYEKEVITNCKIRIFKDYTLNLTKLL
jgi:hypothetical protein